MKLSEVPIGKNARIICDAEFEDMNYCTSKVTEPFLSFMDKEKFIPQINPNAVCMICKADLIDKLPSHVKGIIVSDEPKFLFHQIYNHYVAKGEKKNMETTIGEGCTISHQVSIASKNVRIGRSVVIEPFVVIHENVAIGDNSIIHSNVVIGGRSFSFARANSGIMEGLSDQGCAVIGNSVEIYPFTQIAKGIWQDDVTFIGDHTKIDAHCYIAHGVKVGESTLIASNAAIGGNTTIGDRTWIGLNASIANRITVGNDSRVNMGAVVTKNVADGSSVSGNFAIEHKKFIGFVKNIMNS